MTATKTRRTSPASASNTSATKASRGALAAAQGRTINGGEGTSVVHTFALGRDIGVASVTVYKDKRSLDVRRYYLDEERDEWRPTSKGIRIPVEIAGDVLQALVEARDAGEIK